uniref:WD repeat containing planar cell polarity effector n=1 Tax=Sinocyclocheilus anshuiensis TaxID=1608454 RepID=A0A671L7F9_9TELE
RWSCISGSILFTLKKPTNTKTHSFGRGYPWFLSNRRPEKLRDALKELEELLQSCPVMSVRWRSKQCCQLLLRSGVLVTLILGGAQVERVAIDRTLVGRLPPDTISDAVLCYAEELVTCFIDVLWSDSFTVAVLPQVSVVDLPGGGRRVERRVGLNLTQDVVVCWWPLCNEEVRPWSPVPSAVDRANLVLLACSDTPGLTVLSSIRTDGNPIDCRFSLTQPYHVLTMELHQEAKYSMSELYEEAQTPEVQNCVYECARGHLQRLSGSPLPLTSKPITCCRDPLERWVLLGLQDCSVVLFDPQSGHSQWASCSMVPVVLAWHPSGALLMVGGSQGELQCFDMGLSPLPLRLVSEEPTPDSIGPSLQLSCHIKTSEGLEGIQWAYCPISHGNEGLEANDLLLLRFHGGPLAALRLRLGVFSGAQLGPGDLIQHRLHCEEVDAALGILGNMDWAMMGAECYRSLISITDHLLRKPLDQQTEGQLEAALGMFYAPCRPLSNTVILEYRDPISRYARRFFHHLLRHQRFEKAFLLAVDIGARDLFMVSMHFQTCTNNLWVGYGCMQRTLSWLYFGLERLWAGAARGLRPLAMSRPLSPTITRIPETPESNKRGSLSFTALMAGTLSFLSLSFLTPLNGLVCVTPFLGLLSPCPSDTFPISVHTGRCLSLSLCPFFMQFLSLPPSFTPIALVPIHSPLSAAAEGPN